MDSTEGNDDWMNAEQEEDGTQDWIATGLGFFWLAVVAGIIIGIHVT